MFTRAPCPSPTRVVEEERGVQQTAERRGMCYIQHIYAANRMGSSTFLISDLDNPAELAQIKSTPTDTELAAQIDESESKVRTPTCSTFLPNAYDAYTYHFLVLDRSLNSANSSSLCARARRSFRPPSWTRWTPSGPNGVPNGSGEEKYSISAPPPLALLPQERHHAPTNLTLFCF